VQLILNADDFGFSQDTFEATVECFDRGALTSATIMAGMPATEAAVEFARSDPNHSFGVHLTFTGDGHERPLSAPEQVSSLVAGDGTFLPAKAIRLRAMLRRLSLADIEREIAAQIAAVLDAGVEVSHVDSHRHLHKFASFRIGLARVLPDFGIERVRAVQDVYLHRAVTSPTYWLAPMWRARLRASAATTDHFFMEPASDRPAWQDALLRTVDTLPGRSLEVGVHPGYREPWRERDRLAVQAFAAAAESSGHKLVNWRTLDLNGM
jgi:predicted glycoside hydrolase/deacetylase ChbG (UPF0249 family)